MENDKSPPAASPDPDAELRDRLADAVLAEAVFDGFGRASLTSSALKLGLPAGEAERLFPGGGVAMVAWLSERADRRTVLAMETGGAASLKIRDRIRTAVRLRIGHAGEPEAVRRALALLALPFNAATALRLLYRTVDALWYAAGDTSTDFNFYTKRALLAGVYSSTLLYRLNDRSEGAAATWAFLDRRIEDVMRIEKLKSQVKGWTGASGGSKAASRR